MNIKEMKEIRDILLQARNDPEYNMGSPRALDHLLVHVVGIIECILEEDEKDNELQDTSIPDK